MLRIVECRVMDQVVDRRIQLLGDEQNGRYQDDDQQAVDDHHGDGPRHAEQMNEAVGDRTEDEREQPGEEEDEDDVAEVEEDVRGEADVSVARISRAESQR